MSARHAGGKVPALLLLLCIGVMSCGPQGGGHGAHALFGLHHAALPLMHRALRMGLRGTRGRGLRRACAEDVAQFCPNALAHREQRLCLDEKLQFLSADCKNAVQALRNRRRENFR